MDSIEGLGYPLVFRTQQEPGGAPPPADALRVAVRALEGMQKEALVSDGLSHQTWRMVSDEGPYLKGTDLAPFPLGFFTAGVASTSLGEVLRHADASGIALHDLALTTDHLYTMEGSALRGDMTGGALPVDVTVRIAGGATPEELAELVERSLDTSPAEAYLRGSLRNAFALSHNGRKEPLPGLPTPPRETADPTSDFAVEPASNAYLPDLITKVATAEAIHGVDGGVGSSLKAEQKRTLHVRGEGRWLGEGRTEVEVNLIRPLGSSFRFVAEEGGGSRAMAPSGLAYLSAGLGFCFMTQLGRYAHITKQDLHGYAIVQDNVFSTSRRGAVEQLLPQPVSTSVFLALRASAEDASRTVRMGERTCFLHAALRSRIPSRVKVNANGQEVVKNP